MGSWWDIEVGGRSIPVWGKSYVPDKLMLLFTDEDLFVDPARARAFSHYLDGTDPEAGAAEQSVSWQSGLMGYRVQAGALRQRLELHGFSRDRVSRLSTAFFDEVKQADELAVSWPGRPHRRFESLSGSEITNALTTRAGRAAAAGIPPDSQDRPWESFLHGQWERLREAFDDPRFTLSLSLCRTRPSTAVQLDLTDLVTGGWLTLDERPHRDRRERMAASVAAGGPIVVITEGSTDARRLRRALEVAAPEVAHLFEFLDFSLRPPGGTDRVVSLTKGMAAAGVMNRIVAVLDNDTAGRDAALQLSGLNLPHVKVVQLPAVAYARSYPTLGPAGTAVEDVNGCAVSMEFMFGEDVLRDEARVLAPVRWHGFNERLGAYQGRLEAAAKARIGGVLDRALAAEEGPVPEQVAAGCARLAAILIAAAKPTPFIPATEGSTLTSMWRRDPFCEIQIGP